MLAIPCCGAGFEPHSALPLAMAGVFSDYSEMLPPALLGIKTLASSAVCPSCPSALDMYPAILACGGWRVPGGLHQIM